MNLRVIKLIISEYDDNYVSNIYKEHLMDFKLLKYEIDMLVLVERANSINKVKRSQ